MYGKHTQLHQNLTQQQEIYSISTKIWCFSTPVSPALSGVAVANGVVYFQVNTASGGFLYALDAKNGAKLLEIPIGAAISDVAVADGQVYLGTGITYPPFVS